MQQVPGEWRIAEENPPEEKSHVPRQHERAIFHVCSHSKKLPLSNLRPLSDVYVILRVRITDGLLSERCCGLPSKCLRRFHVLSAAFFCPDVCSVRTSAPGSVLIEAIEL